MASSSAWATALAAPGSGPVAGVWGVAARVGVGCPLRSLALGLVDGAAQVRLEALGHLAQLTDEGAELTQRTGELVGTEHDEGDEADDDQLHAADVEHVAECIPGPLWPEWRDGPSATAPSSSP